MLPDILWENEDCLVLNKPAGLAVQGGAGVGVSLDSLLKAAFPERPLLVHRLDRDTSGLILAAKNRAAAARLSALLGARVVSKRYLALCGGRPGETAGVIRTSLSIRRECKKAETFYRVLGEQSLGVEPEVKAALVELELGTGRMHQIRRHLAGIGCPILGDDKYGDFALNRRLKKTLGLKHLLLHAYRLGIPPGEFIPEGLDIQAPLPAYFKAMAVCCSSCRSTSEMEIPS